MNRMLLIALVLVAGLAVFMGGQGDDDLLASPKGTQAQHKRGRDPAQAGQAVERKSAAGVSKGDAVEPWVAQALVDGVTRWQQRARDASPMDGVGRAAMAWASASPPPPPPPPKPRAEEQAPPPPPPMAPRFPHAWVGRFNEEGAAQQQDGAGASAPGAIARAVLTSPQNTWVVRVGDVIEGQWRIDRIQDRTMSLTYLPLQQQQTIAMR